MRILGCIHPSLLPLGEGSRRHRRARHIGGSESTFVSLGERSCGAGTGGNDGSDAVTVSLLVNDFAAGLLSGEAKQQQEAAMQLWQCSVPSYRVLTLSGPPASVRQAVVNALGGASLLP